MNSDEICFPKAIGCHSYVPPFSLNMEYQRSHVHKDGLLLCDKPWCSWWTPMQPLIASVLLLCSLQPRCWCLSIVEPAETLQSQYVLVAERGSDIGNITGRCHRCSREILQPWTLLFQPSNNLSKRSQSIFKRSIRSKDFCFWILKNGTYAEIHAPSTSSRGKEDTGGSRPKKRWRVSRKTQFFKWVQCWSQGYYSY
jgi:hypothetical protein